MGAQVTGNSSTWQRDGGMAADGPDVTTSSLEETSDRMRGHSEQQQQQQQQQELELEERGTKSREHPKV
ncbi:unnamed protein product [Pleuronectes platessa]|uniref:Uncharacterized protein n=1 Tax=Pleuronectes platessa TaxID=8262 RepID=A0A9N7U6V7_PLEPL|nr:unnamed protein product [Pleuronectes platessa]